MGIPRAPLPHHLLVLALVAGVVGPPLAWSQPSQGGGGDGSQEEDAPDLLALDLEQFAAQPVLAPLEQVVTTVSRGESTVGHSAAAVFVVTEEMIRRSGARHLPELLRMVPGMQVARTDANSWAIGSRGFNDGFANKLLVQIDGRTVYTPLYGGVYWDVQDLVLADIERIEVIRGPGGSLWGANAVNGIINVITKHGRDTQGFYASLVGGSELNTMNTLRVGGRAGEEIRWRAYGRWFDHESSGGPGSSHAPDDWRQQRGGFRLDWSPGDRDEVTFQGDYYKGGGDVPLQAPDSEDVEGGNLLTRWTRSLGEASDLSLQMYVDRASRQDDQFSQDIDTFDVDFQHRPPPVGRHSFLWGAGYRRVYDDLRTLPSPAPFLFDPAIEQIDTKSAFVQDEISLVDDVLSVTLGTKLLEDDFAGFEVQPSARVLWVPDERSSAWAAVSRAVRTPTRAERDLTFFLGGGAELILGDAFDSEELIAYEAGYRRQVSDRFAWDLSIFYNDYDELFSIEQTDPTTFEGANGFSADSYGAELSCQAEICDRWRVHAWYSYLEVDAHADGSADPFGQLATIEGSAPHNQVFLRSSVDVTERLELDVLTRYVDNLPAQGVSSYISADVRISWELTPFLNLALVGQNLLDSDHAEFGSSAGAEIERAFYGSLTLIAP